MICESFLVIHMIILMLKWRYDYRPFIQLPHSTTIISYFWKQGEYKYQTWMSHKFDTCFKWFKKIILLTLECIFDCLTAHKPLRWIPICTTFGWPGLEDLHTSQQTKSQSCFFKRMPVQKYHYEENETTITLSTEQVLDCIGLHQSIPRRKYCGHERSMIGKGQKEGRLPLLD